MLNGRCNILDIYMNAPPDQSYIVFYFICCFKQLLEEDSVNQVKEEALIQSSCGHHPFIAKCHGYWQSRHSLFIGKNFIGYFSTKLICL